MNLRDTSLLALLSVSALPTLVGCSDDLPAGTSDDEVGTLDESGSESGDTGTDAQFGPETEVTLRISDETPPDLMLNMGRDEVAELFGDVAVDIDLLELDSTPLLVNTMEAIKYACGDDWQLDNEDPNHDCSQTPLGQSFGGGDWESSPEYSMVRILTMTPANTVVDGTSLDSVEGITDFLLLFEGGFSGLLADSMDIAVTDEFLDTQSVVASLRRNLIATHPETSDEGTITITLEDALSDMATLSSRLGPAGEHPGILVPEFPTNGVVFGPDFQMSVIAESNLRVLDGVDLGLGKDFISVIADVTGPTFTDEAEFDFNDPDKFSMSGLEPNPTLDLRFAIFENGSFVDSCTSDVSEACINNAPDLPIGDGLVWTLDPWELEYLIADGAREKYSALHTTVTGLLFITLVEVGQNGDPAGWAVFDVPLGWLLGVPPSQFVWELLNEVAQYNLHHLEKGGPATFAEGTANVEFTLEDVPVGITGEEAADAVRPFLQDQASEISGYLLGNYKENSGPVDFYYQRADDGQPYLYFVAEGDLLEGLPYGWTNPGFFADPDLTEKLSSTTVDGVGDTVHEKLRIEAGETTIYAGDDDGERYRLRVVPVEDDLTEVAVYVARRTD